MQELIYTEEDDDYSYRLEELRRQRRIMERRKQRRRKKLIRFFLAWTFVLTLAGLIIFGSVKLVGAVASLFDDDGAVGVTPGDAGTSDGNSDGLHDASGDAGENGLKDTTDGDGTAGGKGDGVNLPDGGGGYAAAGEKGLVIVDAGHGGYDGGTGREELNLYEKNLTLAIAFLLKEELESRGYGVYMTRTEDVFVGLSKRASLANEYPDALAFISVHINSVENHPEVNGIESLTHDRGDCGELADALSASVAGATGAENRGKTFKTALVVCRDTTMPAAIVECGYITNDDECKKLQDSDYQTLIARGIADGLESFIAGRAE